jgi:hypothetical protein
MTGSLFWVLQVKVCHFLRYKNPFKAIEAEFNQAVVQEFKMDTKYSIQQSEILATALTI